jgi:hypothetical protein
MAWHPLHGVACFRTGALQRDHSSFDKRATRSSSTRRTDWALLASMPLERAAGSRSPARMRRAGSSSLAWPWARHSVLVAGHLEMEGRGHGSAPFRPGLTGPALWSPARASAPWVAPWCPMSSTTTRGRSRCPASRSALKPVLSATEGRPLRTGIPPRIDYTTRLPCTPDPDEGQRVLCPLRITGRVSTHSLRSRPRVPIPCLALAGKWVVSQPPDRDPSAVARRPVRADTRRPSQNRAGISPDSNRVPCPVNRSGRARETDSFLTRPWRHWAPVFPAQPGPA